MQQVVASAALRQVASRVAPSNKLLLARRDCRGGGLVHFRRIAFDVSKSSGAHVLVADFP
jgi:hypothetical protein